MLGCVCVWGPLHVIPASDCLLAGPKRERPGSGGCDQPIGGKRV